MFEIMAKLVLQEIPVDGLILDLESLGFDSDEIEEFLESIQE